MMYMASFVDVCVLHLSYALRVYTRFVEIGRVVLLIAGPYKGQIAAISDVVDQTKVCRMVAAWWEF